MYRRLFEQKIPSGTIEVWQSGEIRCLTINGIEQSRININHPERLASPVYQAFLAVFLFIESPGSVLLAGLGGGAIVRFLHHKDPGIKGDVVEIHQEIARVACRYFEFPASQWQLHIDDIRSFRGSDYDLVIVDIGEGAFTPAWLSEEKVLTELKKLLSRDGVLVVNLLVADEASLGNFLAKIRSVFERRTLCLGVADHDNIIVLAFSSFPQCRKPDELKSRLAALEKLWGIDFSYSLNRLISDNPVDSGIF